MTPIFFPMEEPRLRRHPEPQGSTLDSLWSTVQGLCRIPWGDSERDG